MDLLEVREYALSLPFTEETTPFDETTLVYKVNEKMFLLTDMVESEWISVKCDPDYAIELREEHSEITGAYHMNKKHWNMIRTNGDLPASFIKKMIRDSYLLVVKGMPKGQYAKILKAYIECYPE